MNFDAFIRDIEQNNLNVFGVEVYQDSQLVEQYGDTAEHRHPIYSATKAITSIAAGLALDDGKINLTDSILRWLPEKTVTSLPQAQLDVYRHISLERLMTMSVKGYPFRPDGESWLKSCLNLPLENPEVPAFAYSNISAYLAGVAVSCAVNEDLYSYLSRKLFVPLGIQEPPYERCPDGFFYGASKMELTVNELSRVGQLLYNGGTFDGQRILSEEYVRAATGLRIPNHEGGYGYFLWKYRSGFSISGKWKQKCYVLPQDGKMVTFLSHIEESAPIIIESMERNLL